MLKWPAGPQTKVCERCYSLFTNNERDNMKMDKCLFLVFSMSYVLSAAVAGELAEDVIVDTTVTSSKKKSITIDPLTARPLCLLQVNRKQPYGRATGFVVEEQKTYYFCFLCVIFLSTKHADEYLPLLFSRHLASFVVQYLGCGRKPGCVNRLAFSSRIGRRLPAGRSAGPVRSGSGSLRSCRGRRLRFSTDCCTA